VPSLLKIKNLELVVPWSIEPTNSSEEPISMLLEEVRETVTKVVSILHESSRDGETHLYVILVRPTPRAHLARTFLISCQSIAILGRLGEGARGQQLSFAPSSDDVPSLHVPAPSSGFAIPSSSR
jgi:hypothetical protein